MSVPKKLKFPISVPVDSLAMLERSRRFYEKFLTMATPSDGISEIDGLPQLIKNSMPSEADKNEVRKLIENNKEITQVILDTFADHKDVD